MKLRGRSMHIGRPRYSQPRTTTGRAQNSKAAGRRGGDITVPQPIIWKEITTAFEGRAIGGSWAIEDGRVRVRTALGEKSAPLEETNEVWLAFRLLREMAAEGKA
jgi:hypothetical protein